MRVTNSKCIAQNNHNKVLYGIIKNFYFKYKTKKSNAFYLTKTQAFIKLYFSKQNHKAALVNIFLKKWFFLKLNEFNKYLVKLCKKS